MVEKEEGSADTFHESILGKSVSENIQQMAALLK